MLRSLIITGFLSVTLVTPLCAQTAPSGEWKVVVGAGSDNRSKAASKSNGTPYGFGQADWIFANGVYIGSGFETIDSSTSSNLETQVVAGVRPRLAGFDIELKAAWKRQIDADPGADDNAFEYTANLSRAFGPASLRLQVQHSPDGTGGVRDWTWVEGRAGWALTRRLRATAAVGRREQDHGVDYTACDAGLNYAVTSSIRLDVRWYDLNINIPGEQFQDELVGVLSYAF